MLNVYHISIPSINIKIIKININVMFNISMCKCCMNAIQSTVQMAC